MLRKKLTIAIPTYNRAAQLKVCLQRVLDQANNDVEVLISDNCSDDETEQYMHALVPQCENVAYYRNTENIGADRNFLNCFQKATGEYVMLLGDDDFLLPGAVDSILEILDTHPVFVHLNSCNLLSSDPLQLSPPRLDAVNYSTNDKNKIMEKIGIYITFLSGMVLKTEFVQQIQNKEQYIGTYFIQSHIALQTMKNEGTYVIDGRNCLAASANLSVNYDVYYVWFKRYRELLMETGTECGFDPGTMRRVFHDGLDDNITNFVLQFRRSCFPQEKTWNKKYAWEALHDDPCMKRKFWGIINCPYALLPIYRRVLSVKRKRKDR